MKFLSSLFKKNKPVDLETVQALYKACLCRECPPEEGRQHLENLKDGVTVEAFRSMLLESGEYLKVVEPLKREICQIYSDFLFREPTEDELIEHVNLARHLFGDEEGIAKALSSGHVGKQLNIRPLNVEMDVTNKCNLRCKMCLHSHPNYHHAKPNHISVERFQSLADRLFYHVHALSLSFSTEPLMNPRLADLLEICTGYGIHRTYMNSNGLLLNEKIVKTMVDRGFHSVSISIDAATKETYESIRIGGDFQRLLKNIRMVKEIKEAEGSIYPEVHLLFVMMRNNIDELPSLIDLAKELGAQGVNANHMVPYKILDNKEMSLADDKKRCNEMMAAAKGRAEEIGVPFVCPPEFELQVEAHEETGKPKERFDLNVEKKWKRKKHCPFPWHFMAIGHDGNVYPCGWWYGKGPMGNFFEEDIRSIWRNSSFQSLRKELAAHKPGEVCRVCPAAGMGNPDQESAFNLR